MRDSHIRRFVGEYPWAILEGHLDVIVAVLDRHLAGEPLSPEARARMEAEPPKPTATRIGSIATLPLVGVMAHKMNVLHAISGGTSTEVMGQEFSALVDDPAVAAIVLNIDSPGGSMYGLDELWQTIFDARGKKPIIAQANALAASAAYGIATAADEIVVTPSGEVGSVGVVMLHQEASKASADAGITTTIIRSRKGKADHNPHEPLTSEAQKALQARVDEADDRFSDLIAKGRGVNTSDVRRGFGNGRIVSAKEAVRLGMANAIATLPQTIARLQQQLFVPQRPALPARPAGSDTSQEPTKATDQDPTTDADYRLRVALALADLELSSKGSR